MSFFHRSNSGMGRIFSLVGDASPSTSISASVGVGKQRVMISTTIYITPREMVFRLE